MFYASLGVVKLTFWTRRDNLKNVQFSISGVLSKKNPQTRSCSSTTTAYWWRGGVFDFVVWTTLNYHFFDVAPFRKCNLTMTTHVCPLVDLFVCHNLLKGWKLRFLAPIRVLVIFFYRAFFHFRLGMYYLQLLSFNGWPR